MVELSGEKPARRASSPTSAAPPPASAQAPPSRTQTKRRRKNGGRPARLKRRLKREAARAGIAVDSFSPEASTSSPATAAEVEASPAPPAPAAVVEASPALPAPAAVVEASPAHVPAPRAPTQVVEASPIINTSKRVQSSQGRQKQQDMRGFSFVFPPFRNSSQKITEPDPKHSTPEKSSGAPPLLATEVEEHDPEDDEWEDASSNDDPSTWPPCLKHGHNISSLYDLDDL